LLERKKNVSDYVQTAFWTVTFQLSFFELDEYAVSTVIYKRRPQRLILEDCVHAYMILCRLF